MKLGIENDKYINKLCGKKILEKPSEVISHLIFTWNKEDY